MERLPFYRRIGHLGPDFGRQRVTPRGPKVEMVIRLPYSGWTPLPSQLQREYHLPIDLSDGEVKPFISDDAFLGFSFHSLIFSSFEAHFKAALGTHTCSSVTFSLKDQQHMRLQTE